MGPGIQREAAKTVERIGIMPAMCLVFCEQEPVRSDDKHWLESWDLGLENPLEVDTVFHAFTARVINSIEYYCNYFRGTKQERAISALEELACDLAIGFPGNLKQRAGALDPDTYSAEKMRRERCRLLFSERLVEVLKPLCPKPIIFPVVGFDVLVVPTSEMAGAILHRLHLLLNEHVGVVVVGDISDYDNRVRSMFTNGGKS